MSTSLARATHPDLGDTQVQSLFHHLRRDPDIDPDLTPLPNELDEHLERLRFRVRNETALSDAARQRYLTRLDTAAQEDPPDARTWHALQNILPAAGSAQEILNGIYSRSAETMRVDPGKIRMMVQEWKEAPAGAFEECSAPDPAFQYDRIHGLPADEETQRALRKLGYEHFLAQRYPVFVYGTLRQGQGNNHLLDDAYTSISMGQVRGCAVYGGQWGFPYATESHDPHALTVGEVVWLRDDSNGDTARYLMDALEGFHSDRPSGSHYERVRVTATVPSAEGPKDVQAWMYVARGSSQARLMNETPIPHGDWVAARREHLDHRYA